MTSLAIRIQELDDDQLEEFVDLWATQTSQQYQSVERVGGANDKGRDVLQHEVRRVVEQIRALVALHPL